MLALYHDCGYIRHRKDTRHSNGAEYTKVHVSRGGRRFHPTTTRHPPLRPVRLRGWKETSAILACGMPVLLGFGIPAGTLAWLATMAGDPLAPHRFMPFAVNSLMLSGIAATIAVVIAALMAWAARMHPSPLRAVANRFAALGYALPGSVIAVGTLVPDCRTPQRKRANGGVARSSYRIAGSSSSVSRRS